MPQVKAGQTVTAALLSQAYAFGDANQRTVTALTVTQLSSAFTINANDAQVNTIYRLTAYGNGKWGTTAEQANFVVLLDGTNVHSLGVGSGTYAVSTSIDWRTSIMLVVSAIGSSGTYTDLLENVTSPDAAGSTAGATNIRSTTGLAIDTTVSHTLSLGFFWSAGPAASTITCNGSFFERLG